MRHGVEGIVFFDNGFLLLAKESQESNLFNRLEHLSVLFIFEHMPT